MTEPMSFSERIRLLREQRGEIEEVKKPGPAPAPQGTEYSDLVPEVFERDESEQLIDEVISRIGILDAYRKWIGKAVKEDETNLREGLHVSCPWPWHTDPPPKLNAWINQDNKMWHCGKCDRGGDIFTLASIGLGFGSEVPSGSDYHRLREAMAEAYGVHIEKSATGTLAWIDKPLDSQPATPVQEGQEVQEVQEVAPAVPTQQVAAPTQASQQVPEQPVATVTDLHVVSVDYEDPDNEDTLVAYPTIDWRSIVPQDTFLWEYMAAASNDDSPEEYHFWHGMLALGHTVGKKVQLSDSKPVNANLLLCLLGGTGYGKSKSRDYLTDTLGAVVPFKDNGDSTSGVKVLPIPGSGEYLVSTFQHESKDPTTLKPTGHYNSVNGIADFDEFAGLLTRANRQGSTLKQTIMAFADCRREIAIGSIGSGTIQAREPFCSITASTQPKAVRAILTKSDQSSGFLNRWIFAGGPRKEREVFGGVHSNVTVDLGRAIDRLKEVKAWGASERKIVARDPALSEIVTFFKAEIYPIQDSDDSDLLKRMDLIYKKLLLLFAINNREMEVSVDTHRRVKQLVPYLINCYALISQEIGITVSHEITDDILRHIERHQKKFDRGATARDLSRYMQRKRYPTEQVARALSSMVAIGLIDEIKQTGTVGRPTVRYTKAEG